MQALGAFVSVLLLLFVMVVGNVDEEEEKLPTKCHVCKHLVLELYGELERSGKSNEVFRTGQIFQEQRKEINYRKSEVRLNEALEDACSNVLDYKVHKDKVKALRYEKKESMTFSTLKGLKKRGVKVDLGFPDEMWDTPDAEVTRLKSRCELMVETYEDDLTEWYWNHQDKDLTEWLCIERVLNPGEDECLKKSETGKEDEAGKNTGQMEQGKKQDETEEKKTNKQTNKEKKSKGKEKTSSREKKAKTKPTEEDDAEKIQRLIREQTEEQSDRRRKRKNEHVGGRMDERMRHKLQMRLREIDDVDRLRRELRKIRTKEMTEDDYTEVEPWERDMDSRIPDEVRRDMRRRRFERMDDPDDLRRELRTRIIDLEDDEIDDHFLGQNSFVFRELRQRYMTEAEEIRDASELKKRIDDLDALSTILHGRRNRKRWRDRPRHHYGDEL
ncbi:protein canopy homolog 3-like [Montipora capricornis]|uniref:protein canopy homolog 3-like n=1 Tax=Montipora capricornis TaxID=246305 RepID=UPI0035F1FF9D